MNPKETTCPRCGSGELVRSGRRRLRGGLVQIYKCKRCGSFSVRVERDLTEKAVRTKETDEVARKIREVRELGRRRKAASRRAKKIRADLDYIKWARDIISCV